MSTSKQSNQTPSAPKIRIFEAVDQRPSNYILEGTENTENPVRLMCSALRRIPNVSVMKTPSGRFERIRYIKGCNEILVEKQKQLNWEPNSQTGVDEIYMEAGKIIVVDEGDGSILCKFLENMQGNVDNPNRKEDATPLIRELKLEEEAEKGIDEFMTSTKARNIIVSLVQEPTGKNKERSYDKSKIDYLCSLFDIVGIEPNEYGQKLNALIGIANTNPMSFINTIADRNASVAADVKLALQNGVIEFSDDVAMMNQKVLKEFRSKNYDDRVQELIEHLLQPSSTNDHKQLLILIESNRREKLLNQ